MDHTAAIGGGEIAIYNLVSSLDRSRFEPVFVLASDGPLVARLLKLGVETYIVPLAQEVNDTRKDSLNIASFFRLKAVFACLRYVGRLRRIIRRLNVNIVHTNSLKAHIYGGVSGRMAGVPVIWHVRDNIDGSYLPEVVARTVRWLARHLPTYLVANSDSTLKNLCLNRGKQAAVVYSGVRVSHEDQHRVIHDGLNLAEFGADSANPAQRSLKRCMTIAMVGRIAEWKGQHVFIEAAKEVLRDLPGTKFQIIGAPLFGEQKYEAALHEQVERLGIASSVEFLGFREDVAQLVASCDILVHASIIGEPFGQVVVEGMASGKPVIATRGGALPEIVVDGETGLLVEMGDAAEMATAIKLLATHRQLRVALGRAGRRRAIEHFSIEKSAKNMQDVYERLLS